MYTVNVREKARLFVILLVFAWIGTANAQDDTSGGVTGTAAAITEVRELAAALEAYPQHGGDVAGLRSILSEFEQTAAKVDALESGIEERGTTLSASLIRKQFTRQSARANRLQQQMRLRQSISQESIFDDSIDSAKANYEGAKEQFKLALKILQEHMDRQQQVVQKLSN